MFGNTMMNTEFISDDGEGVAKSFRDALPTHYKFKIESFSLLSKASIERYNTTTFDAGGYKWSLCLYPKGNEKKNARDYISLYLVISETKSLPPDWDVNVVFRLFLFDQVRGRYLTVQDTKETGRRFHATKTEWGFDKFIPLRTFNDPSNGYLVDDVCVFGAEVFVCKERSRGIGECLSMIKGARTSKHTWKIDNLLYERRFKQCRSESEVFMAGNHEWKIELYPNGREEGNGNSVSMFLALADSSRHTVGTKLLVDFTLSLMDRNLKKRQASATNWFTTRDDSKGWEKFLPHINIVNPREICIAEAEVTILGVVIPSLEIEGITLDFRGVAIPKCLPECEEVLHYGAPSCSC